MREWTRYGFPENSRSSVINFKIVTLLKTRYGHCLFSWMWLFLLITRDRSVIEVWFGAFCRWITMGVPGYRSIPIYLVLWVNSIGYKYLQACGLPGFCRSWLSWPSLLTYLVIVFGQISVLYIWRSYLFQGRRTFWQTNWVAKTSSVALNGSCSARFILEDIQKHTGLPCLISSHWKELT